MGLIETFIGGLGAFTEVTIVGFIIVVVLLWILGRNAYKS